VFGITNDNTYVFPSKDNTQRHCLPTSVYFYGDIVIYLKKHDSYASIIGGQELFFKASEWEYMDLV